MNYQNITSTETKPHIHSRVSADSYEGLYHSSSVNKPPADVYSFCQNEANLTKVLSELPEKTKNFLDLEFVNANSISDDSYQVVWRNKKAADIHGTLTLTLSPAPADKGTVLIVNAIYGDYSMIDEEPSDLINIFLKRMKALCETGQLATTKGQPNGKDEEEKHSTIKH